MTARMTKRLAPVLLLFGLSLLAAACAPRASTESADPLDSVPAAVKQTVQAEAGGATIQAVAEEAGEDGQTVYEVMMMVDGLARDIIVGADGTLLVDERQVSLESLPPAVRDAVLDGAAGREITIVETVSRRGTLAYYEAKVDSAGTEIEIKVAPDGARMP